jgi:hypothetical protein
MTSPILLIRHPGRDPGSGSLASGGFNRFGVGLGRLLDAGLRPAASSWFFISIPRSVTPAEAGVQDRLESVGPGDFPASAHTSAPCWMPARAGMTPEGI